MPRPSTAHEATAGPATPWLAVGALLAGLGTVLLGPILPTVISLWHLPDSRAGLLLFAKFIGAFLGGSSVPRRLRFGIFLGTLLACIGFGLFPFSTGLATGMDTIFIGGIGLGQIIASTNILAGRRYTSHTGSALASLNFFWSFGAVGAGLLVAAMLPRLGFHGLLLWIAGGFLITGLGGFAQRYRSRKPLGGAEDHGSRLDRATFVRFALLLFLYGGLETCLSGWLTTFTIRYTGAAHWLAGQSGTVLLWMALTVGRALSSVALRFAPEPIVQRIGLVFSFVFTVGLTLSHGAAAISVCCVLLGLSLAPFFPATFGLLMRRSPTSREAGIILAVSGLGAAAFPWLMGQISTHLGSLRIAMAVPMALALLLLGVSFRTDRGTPSPTSLTSVSEGEYSEKISV